MSARAAAPTGPRRVVVGVAGSIAAYKAPTVIRLLRSAGCEVRTVPTQAALRFIGAPALAAVTGSAVSTGVFDDPAAVEHVALGEWAELVLVAPASADLLARVAAGRADDLLSATILTTRAPVVLAPAMHTQMWDNAATVENVATLRRRGLTVIEPASGPLTGHGSGVGRLPEPGDIVERALALLRPSAQPAAQPGAGAGHEALRDLTGRRVVISAGGTREPLDPVRFLGNRSSGRQGLALAAAARRRGARVTLVGANIERALLEPLAGEAQDAGAVDVGDDGDHGEDVGGIEVVEVATAEEMAGAVRRAAARADVVIMAAAVSDYRPLSVSATKMKKRSPAQAGPAGPQTLVLTLTENPDILAGLVSDPPRRDGGRTLVVGFAAETGDGDGDALAHGAAKARRKGADLLAVNAVGESTGFGDVPNAITVLDARGEVVGRAQGTKDAVAEALLSLVAERLA